MRQIDRRVFGPCIDRGLQLGLGLLRVAEPRVNAGPVQPHERVDRRGMAVDERARLAVEDLEQGHGFHQAVGNSSPLPASAGRRSCSNHASASRSKRRASSERPRRWFAIARNGRDSFSCSFSAVSASSNRPAR